MHDDDEEPSQNPRLMRLVLERPRALTVAGAALVAGIFCVSWSHFIGTSWAWIIEAGGYVFLMLVPGLIYRATVAGAERAAILRWLSVIRQEGSPESHRMAARIEASLVAQGWPHHISMTTTAESAQNCREHGGRCPRRTSSTLTFPISVSRAAHHCSRTVYGAGCARRRLNVRPPGSPVTAVAGNEVG